jgi:hypothetical protein
MDALRLLTSDTSWDSADASYPPTCCGSVVGVVVVVVVGTTVVDVVVDVVVSGATVVEMAVVVVDDAVGDTATASGACSDGVVMESPNAGMTRTAERIATNAMRTRDNDRVS